MGWRLRFSDKTVRKFAELLINCQRRKFNFRASGSILTKVFDVVNFGPQTKEVWPQILTDPTCSYTVSWRNSICHVVLTSRVQFWGSFGKWHCCERNFEYLNWLYTRNCGAGRPHVWLCHAFLVFFCFFPSVKKYETTVLGNGWTDFHETLPNDRGET